MSRGWKSGVIWAALAVALAGCGDDGGSGSGESAQTANNAGNNADNNAGNNADNNTAQTCTELGALTEPSVTALVYSDDDATDQSTYASGYEGGRDTLLSGVEVRLIGEGGVVLEEAATCDDGRTGFGGLAEGTYLIDAKLPDGLCGQRNCMRRLPEAVLEGEVKIVTFGDSVPVQGEAPFFPSRLADLMAPLATIDNTNIAIGGTTSQSWLPNTSNFTNRLTPEAADADVIMISLGGNDVLAFVQSQINNPAILSDIDALVEAVEGAIIQIVENLLVIVEAIREVNDTADIVYLLYPDYSLATSNQLWSLVNSFVGSQAVSDVLAIARESVPADAGIILIDLFSASEGLPLDDYLADPLHFNTFGQTLYAEEIFKAFGGVLIGPSPLNSGERTPLGTQQSFSIQAGN